MFALFDFSFQVIVTTLKQGSPLSFLVALSLFGCSIKQVINIIQVATSLDRTRFNAIQFRIVLLYDVMEI